MHRCNGGIRVMLLRNKPIRTLGIGLAAVLASGGMVATGSGPATASPPAKPKVDLVFAIDTTGSMGPYIAAVQDSAKKITDLLFAGADARVALVDYKDFYEDCAEDGYAAQVDLPFTATAVDFGPPVDGLSANGGCDTPESVYSGIMTGLALPWRADAHRALLVMGDAAPHDPEPVTGYTLASVTATANAGGVVVGPVPTGAKAKAKAMSLTTAAEAVPPVSLYTVNIDGGGGPAFADLAEKTGGESYPATDPSSAVEQITEAITDITAGGLVADAGGPYSGAAGEPVTFVGSASGGAGPVTGYDWDFDNNGTYDASSAGPSITHTYPKAYTGSVGLRVATSDPEATATDTADVRILTRVRVKYTGQRAGLSGQQARLKAYVSGPKNTKLAGVPVVFTLGSQTCTALTSAAGQAACLVVTPLAHGTLPVTAHADAGENFLPGGTGELFMIKEPKGRSPVPTPTPTPMPTHS